MKTAEEAFKEWVAGRATENYTAQHIFKVGYEKAKADARHAALTEAAQTAEDYDGKGMDSRNYYDQGGDAQRTRSDINKAILALRDKEGTE